MDKLKISCPCLFGLESVLSGEMKRMGAENIVAEDGRVTFEGSFEDAARANLRLRTAERVQIIVAEFTARSYEELFQGTLAAPWEEFIGRKDAFPVKGRTVKSQLYSMSDCQSIIKKAVAKRLEGVYHQSWFEETGATVQIQFMLLKDRVMLLLDTSGIGLHKRGYRRNSVEAPIKETIAAVFGTGNHARHIQCDHAFVLKHRWNGSEHDPLCQPFCDRRLADTRLTDEARIVLRPAA